MATLASLALTAALVPAAALPALAAEVQDAGTAALSALSSDEVTATGTSGTVTWTLYGDGELVLAPTSGDTGTLESFSGNWGSTPWYSYIGCIDSVAVVGTVICGSCVGCMFAGCGSLETLDLSGLDTPSVTDMSEMFVGCSSLTALDLSGLDTSSVADMSEMFAYCSSLTTVYVSELWSTESASDELDGIFLDCYALVGGNGTTYTAVHSDDFKYARIDTDDTPGYFTYKAYTRNLAESSGDDSTSDSNADGAAAEGASAKSTQSIKVKAKKAVTVKYKKLKKKAISVKASKLCKVTGAKGALTYSKVSVKRNGKKASKKAAKKITVSKAGKVTLKKGLAKGTYKVKLKVKAKATSKYKASKAKTVTVTIKVK